MVRAVRFKHSDREVVVLGQQSLNIALRLLQKTQCVGRHDLRLIHQRGGATGCMLTRTERLRSLGPLDAAERLATSSTSTYAWPSARRTERLHRARGDRELSHPAASRVVGSAVFHAALERRLEQGERAPAVSQSDPERARVTAWHVAGAPRLAAHRGRTESILLS